MVLLSSVGIEFDVIDWVEESESDVILSYIGAFITYLGTFSHGVHVSYVEGFFPFLEEKTHSAAFGDFDGLYAKLEVYFQD